MSEINFCKTFAERVADEKSFELQLRYQLETFFFNEGWASHTNPNANKEGFTAQWTYNDDTIKHFIEDMIRWVHYEKRLQNENSNNTQQKTG